MLSKVLRTLAGIVLLPMAYAVGEAFYTSISSISVLSGTFRILERGVLAYLLIHIFIFRPVYVYVLGHEAVHALATWLCGGRVISFNVTPSGGGVVTSKTNFFIELSPYFVPIYTVMLCPLSLGMHMAGKSGPGVSAVFLFLVGFTMAFHFVLTNEALRLQQPDLMKSGFIFSLVVIFVANIVVIEAIFTPFFESVSLRGFLSDAAANTGDVYTLIYGKILEIMDNIKTWYQGAGF
ncbi:MAG: hypothetical protein PHH49_04870 [Candidatus Omnitrophica bacterium]|nr:hypothetical protein [Candidatus Omnitrophota bacterium]MDD5488277.1 hypothetical protein [Candidatus Omnitrophota bacterium]